MTVDLLIPWISMGAALTTGALGIITLAIPPRSVARLSFAAGMMLLALECVLSFLSSKAGTPATALTFQNYRLYVRALLPGVWLVFSLYYGRHQPPRLSTLWRVLVGLAFVIPLALILVPGQSLGSGDLVRYEAGGTLLLEGRGILVHGVVLLVNLLILVILHGVFQSVAGIMRWRMKFLLLGLAIIFLTTIYTCGWVLFEHTLSYSSNLIQSFSLILGGCLVAWSLFRMGLSAVEVYPSRHFLLSTVATGLVVGYLFIVAAIAHGLSRPRSESAAQLATLVTVAGLLTLGIVMMSDRTRQRALLFFSHNFDRPFYDYRHIWQAFRERTTSVFNEEDYCRAGVEFLSQTLGALSVTIWRFDSRGELAFGGSTLITKDAAWRLLKEAPLPSETIEALKHQQGVLDLDDPSTAWTDARSRLLTTQFREAGGHRLCIPFRSGSEPLGLLLVGDRVSARSYSSEELDLLHVIAGEIGRGLMGLRNSSQLLAAREFQAFQMMSAFVVHDLKNTASSLSLMLQNFRKHHDNPSFREDALRAASSCVNHINEVIQSLGVLRQDLRVKATKCDLNAIVRETLAELGGADFMPVKCTLGALPGMVLDEGQIKRVVANLLLNARDAIGKNGRVELATAMVDARRGQLVVRDNGCGMDPEFVKARLFRPFQSTKKNGLGIGLFHSRMIVEAHHGDIEVETKPGAGTAFRVTLPLQTSYP